MEGGRHDINVDVIRKLNSAVISSFCERENELIRQVYKLVSAHVESLAQCVDTPTLLVLQSEDTCRRVVQVISDHAYMIKERLGVNEKIK